MNALLRYRWVGLLLLLIAAICLYLAYGGERQVEGKSRPGTVLISLGESKTKRLDVVKTGRAPMTRPWAELLHQARQKGWRGSLNGSISGLRTHRDQKELYQRFLEGTGAPAFHPGGPSRHMIKNVRSVGQWAQAVDVSRPEELIAKAKSLGVDLHQPYADEPWHIEARTPFILYRPGQAPPPPKTVRAPLIMPIVPVVLVLLFVSIGMALRDYWGPRHLPGPVIIGLVGASVLAGLLAASSWLLLPLVLASVLLPLEWPGRAQGPSSSSDDSIISW